MRAPTIPKNEAARLEALRSLEILDTPPEPAFDALTELAAHIVGVPIALVSLVDTDRQWFKSRYGLGAPQTPRDISFCGHVVASEAALVVEDALKDERFADNPLVIGEPRVRFYAGIPLQTADGFVVGTLCAIDHVAHTLSEQQRRLLTVLARQVVDQLELRRKNQQLASRLREVDIFRRFFGLSIDLLCTVNQELVFEELSPAWQKTLGWTSDELRAAPLTEFVHPDDIQATLTEAARLLSAQDQTVNFQHRFRHKDGHWVLLSWFAAVNEGLFFACARDMSRLVEKEAALEASLEEASQARTRMRSILASANYAIIETTADGTIREFNPAAERMLGYRADEVIAKVSPAIIHDLDEVVARSKELSIELGTPIEPGFEAFVAKARLGIADECEWTYIRKDGSRFPVVLSVTARLGEKGEIVGFMGVAADITRRKLAEAQLRESQALLNTVFSGMAEGVVIHGPTGAIQDANAAAEQILGLSREQLLGRESIDARWHAERPDGSAFPSDEHPAMITLRSGEPQNDVLMAVAKTSGERALISVNSRALKLAPGGDRAEAVVATFRDITAHASAERASSESEARSRAIIETAVDAIITMDGQGRIDRVNPAVAKVFGYAPEELIGQNVKVLMPSPDRERHDGYLANYARTGERKVIGVGREVMGQRKDGSTFPAELAVSEFFLGGERAFTGVVRDVSARKRAQRELNQFKATLDQTKDAILIFDPVDLRVTYANQGAVQHLGYSLEELLASTPLDLQPLFSESAYRELLEPLISGQASVTTFETVHRHKDGHEIPVEIVLQYMAPAGEPPRCVNVVRDITERKQADRLKSEFVSTVSHELRTPLTSIRGSLGLIAGGVLGELPKEAKEYVDIAVNNADRLVRLINDILDIEKMQSGSMEFKLKAADLSAAVRAAIDVNQGFASSHRVRLVLLGEPPAGEVLVDVDRLMQALTNLISNAVKFSPEGGEVELTIERVGTRFRVSVRDYGPGIPKEFQSRIFSRFAQADSSSTRQKGGTGLGLSITKAIIENMRGQIGFRAGEGGGTVFSLDLPYLHPVAETAAEGGAVRRVLVCEDDPDVSHLLDALLTNAGFRVHVAPTLERARRLMSEHRYDAVTLDLMLADGDASVLISEMRANETTRRVPIIVVSGSDRQLGQAAVLVTDILVKPFDDARLVSVLQQAVAACRNARPRILHVEDDADIRRIVRKTMPDTWHVLSAETVQSARRALGETQFDLVLLDLSLPDGGGQELLPLVGPAQVVIFSAQDASAALSRQVSAALVKSRSTPIDVRDTLVGLMRAAGVPGS